MKHPFDGEDAIRLRLQHVRTPVHDDDLQALVFIEVDVQRGPYGFAQGVLQLGQSLREGAHVVIVNQRQRGDRLDTLPHLRARDRRARQIAQRLGTGTAARLDQLVELREQRAFHGYAEAHERIAHFLPSVTPGELVLGESEGMPGCRIKIPPSCSWPINSGGRALKEPSSTLRETVFQIA